MGKLKREEEEKKEEEEKDQRLYTIPTKKIFPQKREKKREKKKNEPHLSEFSCLPQMKEELATAAVVENKI